MQLAIATGWTLEYIDSMKLSDYNAMLALNSIHPFTYDVQSERDGLLITETFNQRRKKQLKVHELFPYLKQGTPTWIKDKNVMKAEQLIRHHEKMCEINKTTPNYNFARTKINEELVIERDKKEPCPLKICELEKILERINGKGNPVS